MRLPERSEIGGFMRERKAALSGLRPSIGVEAVMQGADNPKLDELERLLNDPEVPMQAARVWELLAEISGERDPASYSRPVAG